MERFRVIFNDCTFNEYEANNFVEAKYKALLSIDPQKMMANVSSIIACQILIDGTYTVINNMDCTN